MSFITRVNADNPIKARVSIPLDSGTVYINASDIIDISSFRYNKAISDNGDLILSSESVQIKTFVTDTLKAMLEYSQGQVIYSDGYIDAGGSSHQIQNIGFTSTDGAKFNNSDRVLLKSNLRVAHWGTLSNKTTVGDYIEFDFTFEDTATHHGINTDQTLAKGSIIELDNIKNVNSTLEFYSFNVTEKRNMFTGQINLVERKQDYLIFEITNLVDTYNNIFLSPNFATARKVNYGTDGQGLAESSSDFEDNYLYDSNGLVQAISFQGDTIQRGLGGIGDYNVKRAAFDDKKDFILSEYDNKTFETPVGGYTPFYENQTTIEKPTDWYLLSNVYMDYSEYFHYSEEWEFTLIHKEDRVDAFTWVKDTLTYYGIPYSVNNIIEPKVTIDIYETEEVPVLELCLRILFEIGLDVYLDGSGEVVITRMLPNSTDVVSSQDGEIWLDGLSSIYGEKVDYIEIKYDYDPINEVFKRNYFYPSELGGSVGEEIQLPHIKSKAIAKDTAIRYFRRKLNNAQSTRILFFNRSLKSALNVEMFDNEIISIPDLDISSKEIQQENQEIDLMADEAFIEAYNFDVIYGDWAIFNESGHDYDSGKVYL